MSNWYLKGHEIWAALEVAGDTDKLPDIEEDDEFVSKELADELYEALKGANEVASRKTDEWDRVHTALAQYEKVVKNG